MAPYARAVFAVIISSCILGIITDFGRIGFDQALMTSYQYVTDNGTYNMRQLANRVWAAGNSQSNGSADLASGSCHRACGYCACDVTGKRDSYADDIAMFTRMLNEEREVMTRAARLTIPRAPPALDNLTEIISETDPDYLIRLAAKPGLKTLVLYPFVLNKNGSSAAVGDISSVHWRRNPLYQFYAEEAMCEFVEKGLPFNGTNATLCAEHKNLTTPGVPIKGGSVYDQHFRAYSPISLVMVPNATVSSAWRFHGNVRARNMLLIQSACKENYDLADLENGGAVNVGEVFVISQVYGRTHYHMNVNNFPRIAPFLPFLQANPSIRIHVMAKKDSRIRSNMEMLGLDPARLVDRSARAKIVYVPQGGGCFKSISPLGLQLLSNAYLAYMDRRYPPVLNKTVILVERTHSRQLSCHDDVVVYLREKAASAGLDFAVFSDEHDISHNDTVQLFRRAALVVAPHGAGLTNLLWTRPPAVVLEVNCKVARPVQCYPFISRDLGHRHYAIEADYGCHNGLTVSIKKMVKYIDVAFGLVEA